MADLVLTFIGPDRPGLVGRLSQLVVEHGGNWQESRSARLAGRFAGILRVTVPDDRADALTSALDAIADEIVVVADRADDDTTADGWRGQLSVVGNDRPGIVRSITAVLARHDINVEEMTTRCESAAMSGHPIFRLEATVLTPAALSAGHVLGELEAIAEDLMVELTAAR